MRNIQEVQHAFTPNVKPDHIMRNAMLRLEKSFLDMAIEIVEFVPDCPDRTAALRKLLECKFTCNQAITHHDATTKKESANADQKSFQENKNIAQGPQGAQKGITPNR